MAGTKYLAGDSDALLRQTRAYLRLLDREAMPPIKRLVFLGALADNFRLLDEHLAAGHPLPKAWERRKGVDLTGSENATEGSRPGGPEPVREEES